MPFVRRKVFAAALAHAVDQRNELVSTQSQIEVMLVFFMLLMDVFLHFLYPFVHQHMKDANDDDRMIPTRYR